MEGEPEAELTGRVERIGLQNSNLSFKTGTSCQPTVRQVRVTDHREAASLVIDLLEAGGHDSDLTGIGHRVVHGGPRYSTPQLVTSDLSKELNRISPFSPEHLPAQIQLIESLADYYPRVPQIACFDTAFHSKIPRVAQILPIPRRFYEKGIQRYGFHGLSYEFLMEELARIGGPEAAKGRVVLAHFGNGCSLAAVKDGQCKDTSMGFTPTSGLPMGTRSGDLDPGLVLYLTRHENLTSEEFHEMVNRKSGLLGVSETSPDLRDLLASEAEDLRAAEAVALFCYQAKKWVGAFSAVLDGLDTLVFTGGIGENAAAIRDRICGGLTHLGIQLDATRNQDNAPIISTDRSASKVRVIRTDEERIIVRAVRRILDTP